jgi:hypothetical protein
MTEIESPGSASVRVRIHILADRDVSKFADLSVVQEATKRL